MGGRLKLDSHHAIERFGIIFTALLSHSAYTQIRNGLRYRRYGRKIDNAEN